VKILDRKFVETAVSIPVGTLNLAGDLVMPEGMVGMAVFAHGSGSSRHSPRNQAVARSLRDQKIGTLLFDLLTETEEWEERYTRHLRFNIALLAERLIAATHCVSNLVIAANWVSKHEAVHGLPLGYFGSSTGAAAALVAAAKMPDKIRAIVSRGGRPDLAGEFLAQVKAPTLFIVGGNDHEVIELTRQARGQFRGQSSLSIISGATHLFEEPGALEEVARQAGDFFLKQFCSNA
jgi:putative phosphoribosyl transferase